VECHWNVTRMYVDLWCNACKGTMEHMWGVNATKVVVSYMALDGILMSFVWNIIKFGPKVDGSQSVMNVELKWNTRGM